MRQATQGSGVCDMGSSPTWGEGVQTQVFSGRSPGLPHPKSPWSQNHAWERGSPLSQAPGLPSGRS